MKTSFFRAAAAFSLLALSAPFACAASESSGRATVAIYDTAATPALLKAATAAGTSETLARIIESMDANFASAFNDTGRFSVLARSDWKAVLREQDFGASGNVGSGAAKIGAALGAKYVLETTVDDFQDYVEKADFKLVGKSAEKRILRLGCIAKLYDASTGAMENAVNVTLDEADISEILSYSDRSGSPSEALPARLARAIASGVARKMAEDAFPARVLSVRMNQVSINRGEASGIRVGEVYDVYAIGDVLKDPDTGEILGRDEFLIGQVQVASVMPKFSKAFIVRDAGIEVGAVVRRQAPARNAGEDSALPANSD